jgi:hypothetical protein
MFPFFVNKLNPSIFISIDYKLSTMSTQVINGKQKTSET